MGKEERLRRKIDFQRVFSQGVSFRDEFFVFYVLKHFPNISSPLKKVDDVSRQTGGTVGIGNKIGFVVSKRVSRKAVTRNRLRRLLREVYRQNKDRLKEGRCLVLVAKKGAAELGFWEAQEVLLHLFRKAGLIKEKT